MFHVFIMLEPFECILTYVLVHGSGFVVFFLYVKCISFIVITVIICSINITGEKSM